ncbi:MAG: serine hydrolase [Myxococcota bacterium]
MTSSPSSTSVESIVDDAISPLIYSDTPSATLTVGAAVGVYIGGTPYFFPFGVSSIGGSAPTESTLFQIGSVTKVFTTSLLGASPYQQGIDAKTFYESNIEDAVPSAYSLQSWQQKITYEQLATFTAGINPSTPAQDSDQTQFIQFIDDRPDPGSLPAANDYSDSSIGLLGQILISAAGISDYSSSTAADSWYDTNLFSPLSMSSSGHTPPPNADVATFYKFESGSYDAVPQSPWTPWGTAGRTLSNVSDMLNFIMANLGVTTINGQSVPSALTKGMAQAQAQWTTTSGGAGQGFAWTSYQAGGQTMLQKNGGLPGCAAVVELCPALGFGVVALSNCGSGSPDQMTGALQPAVGNIMKQLVSLA